MSKYGAGSITETANGKFRVRIPDGAGRKITIGTFPTRVFAKQMQRAALSERMELNLGITFADYGAMWLDRCELEQQKSIKSNRSLWKCHISAAPWFGDPLESITRLQVKNWVTGLRERETTRGSVMSWSQAKHALDQVRLCFETAKLDDELIPSNPAGDVKMWKKNQIDDEWTFLSEDEIHTLVTCPVLPLMQRTAFIVGIYQGLRQGETCGLRWGDVFLEDRPRLEVRRSWGGSTKSRKPRMVPLLPITQRALRTWWKSEGEPNDGPVFASTYRQQRRHFAKGYDFAWANDPEKTYTRLGWKTRAGIARHIRFHDLRHTCASHLIMGTWGRSWKLHEVRDLLGHTDVDVTQRYAHLAPDALLGAAAATKQDRNRTELLVADVLQMLQKQGRAIQDSNLWPSAPEAQTQSMIPRGLPQVGPVSVLSDAEALLTDVADGETISEARIVALAKSVLGLELVGRAAALLAQDPNDRHRLEEAIRLAIAAAEGLSPGGDLALPQPSRGLS